MSCKYIILFVAFLFLAQSCAAKHVPHIIKLDEGSDVYYQFVHADLLAMKDETRQATSELLKLVKDYPDLAFFHYLLAQNYANSQRLDDAVVECKKAVELAPKFMEARIFLGKLYASQKKDSEAVKVLSAVVHEDQRQEDVYPLLAMEYVTLGEYSKAIETLKQMLAINPDSVSAYLHLGSIYDENLHNSDEAIKMYREALNIDPSNTATLNLLGEIYLKNKRPRRALETFIELGRLEPDDVAVKLRIALIYYDLKNYNQAIDIFREILAANPDADKIRFYLGVLYENSRQFQKASDEFAAVPPNSGFYKDARLHMAAIGRDMGKTSDAIAALSQSIGEKPKQAEFYEYLAALYEEVKDIPQAIDALKRGHAALPDDEKVIFLLGILYEKARERENAIGAMREVLRINPQNAGALNYIGYTCAEMDKNLDEALKFVEKALVLRPDDAYITDSLGWVYYKMGDYEQALKYLLKAAGLVRGEPTVFYHIGETYLKMGKLNEAKKYFEKARATSSKKKDIDEEEFTRIKERLEELRIKGKKTTRALKLERELEKYADETSAVRALARVDISNGSEDHKTSAAIAMTRPANIRVDAMDELADAWAVAGSDGEKAWFWIPAKSKLYSEPAVKKSLRRFSNFDWEISELVSLSAGSPPIGGKGILESGSSKEMHFVTDDGRIHIWLDGETKRVSKCARYSENGGHMDYTAEFSDYRRVGNIFFPHVVDAVFPDHGAKMTIRYDEVTLGGEIDPKIFGPPSGNKRRGK